mgnify:CR=1 FL=1
MKSLKISTIIGFTVLIMVIQSCEHTDLKEVPLADLGVAYALSTKQGFENFMTGLHVAARDEMTGVDDALTYYIPMFAGTDVATFGHDGIVRTDYNNFLLPTVNTVSYVWRWAYREMLNRSNTIIVYGKDPSLNHIWDNETEQNAMVAEAKFFRAYTYNMLANLYGGVPIVDTIITTPKTDFVRATRKEVLEFAREDLKFASQWLPPTVQQEGRIVKAAADHLLTEVYISLGQYEEAVASANKVIDSGLYELMTERFGSEINEPGDVFSDLFRDGNQNRSSGNRESIYVWQFEDMTRGGQGGTRGNPRLRYWGARYFQELWDPDGVPANIVVDSLGRGVAHIRPNTWWIYDLWRSDWDNDIRNSRHNIRRDFYYTNPASAYFGQKILREHLTTHIDTMRTIYPYPRKVEGKVGTMTHTAISWSGRTYQDMMVFRLAETYLLRAEAYFRMNDLENAAEDINVVRRRANATPIGPQDVTEDYILDERARELMAEEPRRRTLVRMGRLVDRVRRYNMRAETRNSIQDFHEWWPIPQTAVDANIGARLEQNTGY